MLTKTFFTALSVLATCVAAGMYPAKGPVKMLTQADFKKVLSEDVSLPAPLMIVLI